MSKKGLDRIEELFGESFVRRLQHTKQSWSIQDAVETEFRSGEKNPPDRVRFTRWNPNARVGRGDLCLNVINSTMRHYNIRTEPEAVKKLLRFGLHAIMREQGEEMIQLQELKDAGSIVGEYLEDDTVTQSLLDEPEGLSVPWGRTPKNKPSFQCSIIWTQKLRAEEMANHLQLAQSDVLQWGILAAGEELGSIDIIAPPLHKKIRSLLSEIDEEIKNKRIAKQLIVQGGIWEGLTSGNGEEFAIELKEECPTVYEDIEADLIR